MFIFSFIQLSLRKQWKKESRRKEWNMDESKGGGQSMLNCKWSLLAWKRVYKVKQNIPRKTETTWSEIPLLKQISVNQMINSTFAMCQLQMATTRINDI